MPRVSVTVPHQYPPEEVIQRAGPHIEKMIEDFEGRDFDLNWTGNHGEFSFSSLIFQISGEIDVTADSITIAVDLPFAAMMFKDKVEKAIHKNLSRVVAAGGEAST
jgi:Putative polyhydroxyalkanoic acid system protein (PHA_gran_rgn)